MHKPPSSNSETFRRQGHRLTPQRQMVLAVIEQATEHLSAEDICQRVQERYPFVSLSTIYRTLDLLKTLELVREVHLLGEQRFYESAGGGIHHHLLCRGCGTVLHADDALLDELRIELERSYHFSTLSLDLIAIGYCEDCQPAKQE
ncbi:MAG TPA: Fur family transcriptional regulator [Ktedonobacterales bacterium]|jgi:Fe2+ or Zn2+ uptake regulation protein